MEKLIEIIRDNQPFLLKRTIHYATLHNYVKYTSTLEEAWVASVSGLSDALTECIKAGNVPEIDVDQDFVNEPVVGFGVLEARRHRQRGVTLEMFLGLMKYYRQAYIDLITDSVADHNQRLLFALWVNRFFDQNEIAFCKEWNSQKTKSLLSELQTANRELINEKNKYLTIFESIPTPVIFFDTDHYCSNINYAAQRFLQEHLFSPGYMYYSDRQKQKAEDIIPCIYQEYQAFYRGSGTEAAVEKDCESASGKRNIIIKFHRMLDVSGKFAGTVIIFTDQTEQKQIEEQLRYMSFYDMLTGLYNRSYLEQKITQLLPGKGDMIGVVSCDIDGLKLVNDNLGHNAGDLLIKLSADILKSSFLESDLVFRTGGDEFLILMPGSGDDEVQKVCERIRLKIEQNNAQNLKKPISVSIGRAAGRLFSGNDMHEIIKAADSLMYSEKKANHQKFDQLFQERFKEFANDLFS